MQCAWAKRLGEMAASVGILECRECRLTFDTKKQFEIHTRRFCVKAGFTDAKEHALAARKEYEKYRNRVDARAPDPDMALLDQEMLVDEEAEKFMQERRKASGRMQGELHSQRAELQADSSHEDKIRKLLEELEKTKQSEIEAILKREKFSRNLKDMDRRHLEMQQEEKRKELMAVQKEREEMEQMEAAFREELEAMQQQQLELAENMATESKRMAKETKDSENSAQQSYLSQQLEDAKEHGRKVAQMQANRLEKLEQQKKLQKQLERLQNGEFPPEGITVGSVTIDSVERAKPTKVQFGDGPQPGARDKESVDQLIGRLQRTMAEDQMKLKQLQEAGRSQDDWDPSPERPVSAHRLEELAAELLGDASEKFDDAIADAFEVHEGGSKAIAEATGISDENLRRKVNDLQTKFPPIATETPRSETEEQFKERRREQSRSGSPHKLPHLTPQRSFAVGMLGMPEEKARGSPHDTHDRHSRPGATMRARNSTMHDAEPAAPEQSSYRQHGTPQPPRTEPAEHSTPSHPQEQQQAGQQPQDWHQQQQHQQFPYGYPYGYPPQPPSSQYGGYPVPPGQPGYPAPPPGQQPPYGYGMPAAQNPYGVYGMPPMQNPMQTQLMQLQQQAQMLMQQHAQENQMLDELHRGDEVPSADETGARTSSASRVRTEAELKHEELMADHKRMMDQMAWRMEQLQVEQQLQALQDADEKRQRERELQKKQEQAQQYLQQAKLRSQLAKHLPGTVLPADAPKRTDPRLYDPKAGFSVYFDYVSGMPRKALQCAVVYGIYQGNRPQKPVKSLPLQDTEEAGPDGQVCIFKETRSFQNVPASDKLLLVLEPQFSTHLSSDPSQRAQTRPLGWTTLPIFRKGDGGLLNAGLYRLPLFRTPVTPSTPANLLNEKPKKFEEALGDAHPTEIYIRIVSNTSPLEKTINDNFALLPPDTNAQYYRPYSDGRGPYAESQFHAPQVLTERPPQSSPEPVGSTTNTVRENFETPSGEENVSQSSPVQSQNAGPEPEPEPEAQPAERTGRSSSHISSLYAAGKMDAHAQRARVHAADQRQTIYAIVDKLQNYSSQPADIVVKLRIVPMYQVGDVVSDGSGKQCTVVAHRGDQLDVTSRDSGQNYVVNVDDAQPVNDSGAVKPLASAARTTDPGQAKVTEVGTLSWHENFMFTQTRAHVSTGMLVTVHSVERGDQSLIGWSKLELFSSTGGSDDHLTFQAGSHELKLMLPPADMCGSLDSKSQVGTATIKIRVSTDSLAGEPLSREHTPAGSRPSSRFSNHRHSSKNDFRGDRQRGSPRRPSRQTGTGFMSPDGEASAKYQKHGYPTKALQQEVGSGRMVKVSRDAWRHCANVPDPHPETAPFGVDLYVDGCRGLPDNTTITRVDFEIRTSNHDAFGKADNAGKALCDVNSKTFNPHVSLRHEIREQGSVDPTGTLLLIVRTIDRFTKKSVTIGYAVLNLFVDARPGKGRAQPESQNVRDFILNAGGHELPLHKFPPPSTKSLSADSCDDIAAVPCATVLVRLHEAARSDDGLRVLSTNDVEERDWESKGLVIPIPEYRDNAYDSTRVARVMTEQAGKLFNKRLKHRADVTLKDTLLHAGDGGESMSAKPDAEIAEWMNTLLETQKPNGNDVPMDYAYIAEYDPDEGFDVAVDSIRGLHHTVWPSATHCIGPPASFYADPPLTKNVNLTLTHDLSSEAKNPSFKDGLVKYPGEMYKANKCVLIGVHTLSKPFLRRSKEMEHASIAWAILPIFHDTGQYLRTGAYRLPLFQGVPSKGLVADLNLGKPPLEALDGSIRSNQARPYEWGSVVVRLVDYWRGGEFASAPDPSPSNPDSINHMFIPEAHREKHKQAIRSSDTLAKLANQDKNTPADFYRNDMNKQMALNLKISHIVGLAGR